MTKTLRQDQRYEYEANQNRDQDCNYLYKSQLINRISRN